MALAPDVGTDRVVRRLVERGMAVYEIAHHEQTLEDFYLGLMRKDENRGTPDFDEPQRGSKGESG